MTKKAIGFLTLSVQCGREIDCRGFLDEVEDEIHALAKNKGGIAPTTSSASESPKGWTEVFGLRFEEQAWSKVDSFASNIVRMVRSKGIPNRCNIDLEKRETLESGGRLFRRKVFAKRETRWQLHVDPVQPARVAKKIVVPSRIEYLAELVDRYEEVGGKDFDYIFRLQTSPRDFLNKLPQAEAEELRQAYERIVENQDHYWIMEWVQEDGDDLNEKATVLHFLALLDRINESGFSGTSYVELVDWGALS